MDALRVGVIGIGRMGTTHAKNFVGRVEGARLVAVSDVDKERLERFAAEIGGVETFIDYRELIASDRVDAIVIVGPTDQREEMLLEAFPTGKPIFCEKPLSLSLEGVRRIKSAAAEHRPFLQVGFMRRFDPGYAAARRTIEEGAIGRPIAVHAISLDPHLPSYEYIASSGGIFADLSIHDFDIVRFLMGDEAVSVYSVGGVYKYDRLLEYGDVDNSLCTLRFAQGGFGSVHGSRNATYGYDIRAEVYGTEGAVRIGYERQTPLLLLQKGGASHDFVPYFFERFESAYLLEMQAFVDAVRRGDPPPVGIEDGERALMIAEAARRSLETGAPEPIG